MAGATGLEPATFGVTGRRSNQLSYAPTALQREYARAREIRDPPGQVKARPGGRREASARRAQLSPDTVARPDFRGKSALGVSKCVRNGQKSRIFLPVHAESPQKSGFSAIAHVKRRENRLCDRQFLRCSSVE